MMVERTFGVLSYRLRGYATRLLILETGRAAIDLYSGRLTLSDDEMRAAQQSDLAAAAAQPLAPVRILLIGQVSAGKTHCAAQRPQIRRRSALGMMTAKSGSHPQKGQ